MHGLRFIRALFASRRQPKRTLGRPRPLCESLEGRQLLNAAWSTPDFNNATYSAGGITAPAEVHRFDMGGTSGGKDAFFMAGPGSGKAAPSAQAKADMQTLQTDLKAFQSEIPSSLTSTIQADEATIRKALDALSPSQRKALMPTMPTSPPSATATPPDPMTQLQTLLNGANVPNSSQILSDFQNYETTVKALDPTLQTKIATDQANLAKDMGVTLPAGTSTPVGLPVLGFPGGPGGFTAKAGLDAGLGMGMHVMIRKP